MTDEQWLWLFVNQLIDTDEQLEKLCSKCKNEVFSDDKCTRCGKPRDSGEQFINPNFDNSRFDRLSKNGAVDSDDDLELARRIMGDDYGK